MIQFNLLPDVKLEFIKARRQKHVIILSSIALAGGMLAILVLLFFVVNVLQKKHLSDLNGDIKKYTDQIQSTPDIDKILTIQNQLSSLPELHNKKVVSSRVFTYMSQVTPVQVSISRFDIDFANSSLAFSGAADTLETVNKFTDTLKFITFKTGQDSEPKPAFSNVVLSSFTRDDKGAHYEITANFDSVIFDSANDVALTVPKIISTRSETEKPSALFQESTQPKGTGQ